MIKIINKIWFMNIGDGWKKYNMIELHNYICKRGLLIK